MQGRRPQAKGCQGPPEAPWSLRREHGPADILISTPRSGREYTSVSEDIHSHAHSHCLCASHGHTHTCNHTCTHTQTRTCSHGLAHSQCILILAYILTSIRTHTCTRSYPCTYSHRARGGARVSGRGTEVLKQNLMGPPCTLACTRPPVAQAPSTVFLRPLGSF